MLSSNDVLASVVIGFLILVVVLLVIREVICWYWKINQQIALLKEIRDALRQPVLPLSASSPSSGRDVTQQK